jgi:hypothetical protein
MSILVNDDPVDALAMLVHAGRAESRGRAMVEKLKELIPQHMFKIPIQAAPQTQAPRQAERGQKADAPVRESRHPAGSVHRGVEDGFGLESVFGPMRTFAQPAAREMRTKIQIQRSALPTVQMPRITGDDDASINGNIHPRISRPPPAMTYRSSAAGRSG